MVATGLPPARSGHQTAEAEADGISAVARARSASVAAGALEGDAAADAAVADASVPSSGLRPDLAEVGSLAEELLGRDLRGALRANTLTLGHLRYAVAAKLGKDHNVRRTVNSVSFVLLRLKEDKAVTALLKGKMIAMLQRETEQPSAAFPDHDPTRGDPRADGAEPPFGDAAPDPPPAAAPLPPSAPIRLFLRRQKKAVPNPAAPIMTAPPLEAPTAALQVRHETRLRMILRCQIENGSPCRTENDSPRR